jgi:hypothetical protein
LKAAAQYRTRAAQTTAIREQREYEALAGAISERVWMLANVENRSVRCALRRKRNLERPNDAKPKAAKQCAIIARENAEREKTARLKALRLARTADD